MHFWDLLTDIGILLGSSLVLGGIAMRLGLSPLVGYLLAGMFLGGPGSLHLIKSPVEIEAIAEMGVSLLLFSLGLEFSWNTIKTFPGKLIKAGLLQILLTPLLIIVIFYFLQFDIKIGVLIGLMLTLSSTATVLRTLIDLAEIDSLHGRNSTAVLLLQDIAVVPFTIIVSFLASGHSESQLFSDLLMTVGGVIALVLGLYLLLNKIAAPVLHVFTLEHNREMAILLAIIISIGSAWTAHQIGISPAIGAFIAGMLLGSSPFASQIRVDVSSLKIIFLTLFFSAVGMLADPIWIVNNFAFVILVTILIMFFKTLVSFVIFKFCDNSIAVSIASALCISQVGEFAFVLSNLAKDAHLLTDDLYQVIISVTIVSLFITTFLIKSGPYLGLTMQRLLLGIKETANGPAATPDVHKADIFILGYGPAGSEVARQLKEPYHQRIAVLDLNRACIERALDQSFESYIGDVRQIEILKHHGIANAKLVIITIPSFEASVKAIHNVKRLAPDAYILVRSRYEIHTSGFHKAGAHEIFNEEFTVGQRLGESALKYLKEIPSNG